MAATIHLMTVEAFRKLPEDQGPVYHELRHGELVAVTNLEALSTWRSPFARFRNTNSGLLTLPMFPRIDFSKPIQKTISTALLR